MYMHQPMHVLNWTASEVSGVLIFYILDDKLKIPAIHAVSSGISHFDSTCPVGFFFRGHK